MTTLNSSQRKYLTQLAHNLEPVIIVGKNGITDFLIRALKDSLSTHELVKVKFNEYKENKKEIAAILTEKTGAALIRIIGNIAIFYRQAEDEKYKQIKIPD